MQRPEDQDLRIFSPPRMLRQFQNIVATLPKRASAAALVVAVAAALPAKAEEPHRLESLAWTIKSQLDENHDHNLMVVIGIGMMRMMRGGKPLVILNVSTDTADYNIYTAAVAALPQAATVAVDVILTLTASGGFHASSVSAKALSTGSAWISGSTIKFINNGACTGAGGTGGGGGDGTSSAANGRVGGAGGDVINMQWPMSIDNTNGYILAGGGGGGGGADYNVGVAAAGGGGGGCGIGYAGGHGGPASIYTATGQTDGDDFSGIGFNVGHGGLGGSGGVDSFYSVNAGNGGSNTTSGLTPPHPGQTQDYAQNGCTGENSTSDNHFGGAGGAPGRAVLTNSNVLTWLGGNNPTQVKGAVV